METINIISQINNVGIESSLMILIKLFFIVGGIMYLIFSLVVVRQIALMKKTLMTPLSPLVTLLGYIHLALSVFALFFFFLHF